MKEHFYKSTALTTAQLQQLIKKNNQAALTRFLVIYSLFFVAFYGVVVSWSSDNWLVIIASQCLFGAMICSFFACGHESVHNTAFKSLRMNQWASFLIGIPFMYAPSMFRELHFAHHRHTHIPGLDPEISFAGKPVPSVISNLPMYLSWLSGFPLYFAKLLMLIAGASSMPEVLRKNIYPFVDSRVRWQMFFESCFILAINGGLLYLAIYVNSGFWGYFVGQLVGHCFLGFYTSPEHNGLPHDGSIVEKTRSMNAPKWLKWLMWNMPYHAEHHAYPAVPFHALPDLHKIMQEELKHNEHSYPSFHWSTLKNVTVRNKK